MTPPASIHGSVVLVGSRAVLIRGPSGSGKSRLALRLVDGPPLAGSLPSRLVADDRVLLEEAHGRLVARAPAGLAGLIELRGVGILARPHEPAAVVRLVVDLAAADAARLPEPEAGRVALGSVILPRFAVAEGADPLPGLRDWLFRSGNRVSSPQPQR